MLSKAALPRRVAELHVRHPHNMVGCVSFIWKATLSANTSNVLCVSLYRRTTS